LVQVGGVYEQQVKPVLVQNQSLRKSIHFLSKQSFHRAAVLIF